MQPQSPAPQDNPYDFIMNPSNQPAQKGFNLGSGKQKIILIVGGGLVLLILFLIVTSLLGGGDKNYQTKLMGIAQDQTEIIRVANLAKIEKSVRDEQTLNLAYNTDLSISTSKVQIIKLLQKKAKKVNEKQLVLKKDPKTDTKLKTASQNNTYDAIFVEVFKSLLKTYQTDLKAAYSSASKNDKPVIKDALDTATILLGEDSK